MPHIAEYRASSKALELPLLQNLPPLPADQAALAWLTSRYRFPSREVAAVVADHAFRNGRGS